jgi:diguanylate cyclase (GGDEF)-like protein
MQKPQDGYHSMGGKRRVLVVDDEAINREMLGMILGDDYEVLYAEDGEKALTICGEQKDFLSLVLLDLMMPVLSGMEVLSRMKGDPDLRVIPVIVVTADQEAETRSLGEGAIDFIPKPYPQRDVILARVRRIIELTEDRDLIRRTERDPLTGLYNREFFYNYTKQLDLRQPDTPMDAIVMDVNHFRMINERFGTAYGDMILRGVASSVRSSAQENGGIACRREADTFLIYCPHREDYDSILENASMILEGAESSAGSRVWLRMGIYPNADRTLDIERRFDRAQIAADMVHGSFAKAVGIYDKELHDKELYAEQLIDGFRRAIEDRQFVVHYQPKFDIQADTPALFGCEALVRWNHPELGMISPGVFIPLFEENGLIQELDLYVWKETARQIAEWRKDLSVAVPVSVNVSRIDLYDPKLPDILQNVVEENGISYEDIHLEITESAYTQDSENIVRMISELRGLGFRIEMDDFGTGYSSLNMISKLPIDVLKLDMQFIRSAFREDGDTRMLEIIIDLAEYLKVPVIAEGVETVEQCRALKKMGCDMAQGYYFSKPLPASGFASFLTELAGQQAAEKEIAPEGARNAETVSGGGNKSEEEPVPAAQSAPQKKKGKSQTVRAPKLRTVSIVFVAAALLAAIVLFLSDISLTKGYQRMEHASSRYIIAQTAASDMESGSDYLTDRVRCFVVTGEIRYLRDFFEEVEVTRRRDNALDDLEELLENSDNDAYSNLAAALSLSNELVERENLAMRLMLEAGDYASEDIPAAIAGIALSAEDAALNSEAKIRKAQGLVFDDSYMEVKERIRENVRLCTEELIRSSREEVDRASERMAFYVKIQTLLTVVFLLIVLVMVIFITERVRKPLTQMVEQMRKQESIPPKGAEELRFVTRTYNTILEENLAARERLSHQASHDPLTGLFNRGAYEMMLESVDMEHVALIMIDVNDFKQVNDTYGHDVGDRVLKRVAQVLKHSFRSVDVICRIGGDEFVVLMTRANSTMEDLVRGKIERANFQLMHPEDDLPPFSLSVGVAFSDRQNPRGDIFKDADTALYRVKNSRIKGGGGGCEIF